MNMASSKVLFIIKSKSKLQFQFLILHSCLLLSLSYTTNNGFHSIDLESLSHSSSCNHHPSTGKPSKPPTPSTIQVYTPCPPLPLTADDARVRSIQAKVRRATTSDAFNDVKATLPAHLGIGNYAVTVSLGTPPKSLSLNFDTGSDLTWTQCQPCSGSCYPQDDPIFDPSSSTTYSKIQCAAPQCSTLRLSPGVFATCAVTDCNYRLQYGDRSTSAGEFSKDTLTLTPDDTVPDFLFGCGQENRGLFVKSAGLLGLGRDAISIVSQTEKKYGKYFSYCLPSTPSSTGHLTFGKTGSPSSGVAFAPFANSRGTSFYFLDITGISVAGQELSIDRTIFTTAGNLIDSGTVITRLPATAYGALSQAFQEGMTSYPRAPPTTLLDTCYDLSNFTTVTLPRIAFTFAGNLKVNLDFYQMLSIHSIQQVCLAFAANQNDQDVGIFGNIQQRGLEVVYDVAGGNIGLGPGGC
ncbi:aspartyl protease family protein At5g10770-like [Andrographis paniculata]|uniref:aspartyl protease family protein At5g10770-like n=1 Tax=Andrographis paniculata TaxID=175694 RepID=UPI0021E86339|nr:aspartyl protease family protein At5g10770-like [Andrographis paniculata]